MAHGILGDLNEDRITGLQCEFNALGLTIETCGIPVDLAGVQHRITATTDIDEGSFHAGQDVLHTTEVDVTHHRAIATASDVVLDEHAIFENGDLRAIAFLSNGHDAIDCLATCEKLCFGQDRRTATTCLAAFATTLLLRLQSRGSAHVADFVVVVVVAAALAARLAHLDDSVRRVIGRRLQITIGSAATATTTALATLGVVIGIRVG